MGKPVLADENLLNILTPLSSKEGFTPGLIIGQPSQKKDFVIHLTPTPMLKEDASAEDDCVKEFEQIEENWLKIHMNNVTRSLPGGMYVLGLFIVGPKDIFNDKLGLQKVRSIISCLHSNSKFNIYLYGNNPATNIIVLHFCSKSKRYQCKSFDVQNMNLSMSSVSWKFVENPTSWYTIDCQYMMASLLPVFSFNAKETSLKKLLKDILANYKKSVDNCICLLNGYFNKNSTCETLEDIRNLIINKIRNENEDHEDPRLEESESFNTFRAMMFSESQETSSEGRDQIEIVPARENVKFDGVIMSKTFVHTSSTIEEAVNAIKEDLVRSFAARLGLHCDSLEDSSESAVNDSIHHTPPRRVLIEHPSNGIMFSEYMFADDTKEDVVTVFKENLGIEALPESIIDLELPEGSFEEEVHIKTEKEKPTGQVNLLFAGLIGAIIVLIISILAHFLL